MKKNDQGTISRIAWCILRFIAYTDGLAILALVVIFLILALPVAFTIRIILSIIVFVMSVYLSYRKVINKRKGTRIKD